MKKQDYNITIVAKATDEEAFNAINDITRWWSTDFEGQSAKQGDVFTVRFDKTFITLKITEFIPNKKISWQVIDCYKDWLKNNKKEWLGTTMEWEIVKQGDKVHIIFTHLGLVPGIECYEGCEKAWDFYLEESLLKLITEEQGIPELK